MLPDTLPLYNVARPPVPVVIPGTPLMTMLPPVEVPAAAVLPPLSAMALDVVLVVETPFETVKSPASVAMLTAPVALMPLVLPTVPMVSALLS